MAEIKTQILCIIMIIRKFICVVIRRRDTIRRRTTHLEIHNRGSMYIEIYRDRRRKCDTEIRRYIAISKNCCLKLSKVLRKKETLETKKEC